MGEAQRAVRAHYSDKRGKDGPNPVNALRRVDSEANEVSGAIRLRSNRPSEARGFSGFVSHNLSYISLVSLLTGCPQSIGWTFCVPWFVSI
jgi:hypothetical protein